MEIKKSTDLEDKTYFFYIYSMEKECLDCGDTIRGRADKKFCSDQCRNSYNNKLKRYANNYMRNVNNILKKNRRILATLNPHGKAKINKAKLTEKGFNFNFHTNTYKTKTGNIYYFCYEQGYLPLEQNMLALVVRKEYIK